MEDKERIDEDVEGHKKKSLMAKDEPQDESEETEDDVEGHALRNKPTAL